MSFFLGNKFSKPYCSVNIVAADKIRGNIVDCMWKIW